MKTKTHKAMVQEKRQENTNYILCLLQMNTGDMLALQMEICTIYLKCLHLPEYDIAQFMSNDTFWNWYKNWWYIVDEELTDGELTTLMSIYLEHGLDDVRHRYRMAHMGMLKNSPTVESSYAYMVSQLNRGR